MNRSAALLVIILAVTGCGKISNTVTVINGTESDVRQIEVSVCDSTWLIEELSPGHSREFTISYNRDDHFQVETPDTSVSFGYVTHGMIEERVVITLKEDSIDFEQTSGEY